MSDWIFVGHVHTRHSFDSLTSPRALAAHAVARGIDVLAVTDHDTWRGALETRLAAEEQRLPLQVLVGSEVSTDQGDVVGLFLQSDLRERSAPRFCDAVHEQGGLVLLPHPYRWHRLDETLLSRVDLIEVYNARTTRSDNERAEALARSRGLPVLAGPDAHRLEELGLARVEFAGAVPTDEAGLKQALLRAPRQLHGVRGTIWDTWFSEATVLMRRPSRALAWHVARGALRRVLKPGKYALG